MTKSEGQLGSFQEHQLRRALLTLGALRSYRAIHGFAVD